MYFVSFVSVKLITYDFKYLTAIILTCDGSQGYHQIVSCLATSLSWYFSFLEQKNTFHKNSTLKFKNGYSFPKLPEVGIGGDPLHFNQLSDAELDELANFNPTLTYGQAKQAPPQDFVPAHVAWDKKVSLIWLADLSYNFFFVFFFFFPCSYI